MLEKKLGIFTEEDINAINSEIEMESNVDVKKSKSLAVALAAPCWVGGGAVAAGGFAAAGV